MAISKKIMMLTAEALKDRVLTYVERQTIVKAALNDGIPEAEINQYINNALQRRLNDFSREELKRCPACGSQIPLLSHQCQYCGAELEHHENKDINVLNVQGEEMQIIRRENLKTELERQNIKNCPDCGAPFPLISNVCSFCGHILHEKSDSEFNVETLIQNIQAAIDKLKKAPKPTFLTVLMFRIDVILFYFAAAFLIISSAADDTSYLCWSSFLLITSLIMLAAKSMQKGDSPVQVADKEYYSAINSYEMYSRQTDTLYGENYDAKKLLENYSGEINKIKKMRSTNRSIITSLFLLMMAVPVILYLRAPSISEQYQISRNTYPKIYEMSEFSKVLKPHPVYPVSDMYAGFFSVKDDATLMFDPIMEGGYRINEYDAEAGKIVYKIRVDNLNLISTGKKNGDSDTCVLKVFLWDKNKKPVGKDLYPIIIRFHDDDDDVSVMLKNGKGHYYGDFVSKKSTNNYDRLKEVADSAYYYTVF